MAGLVDRRCGVYGEDFRLSREAGGHGSDLATSVLVRVEMDPTQHLF